MPKNKRVLFFLISFLLIYQPGLVSAAQATRRISSQIKYIDKYFERDLKQGDKIYIYLGEQKIATVDKQGDLYYNLDDHLASPLLITNQAGQLVEANEYQPFGKLRSSESEIVNNYKFSDKEQDQENNWQYFGARYYDNILGRFSSIDPVYLHSVGQYLSDPQQLNTYSYARNNPIKLIDQDGEKVSEYQPYYNSGKIYDYGQAFGIYRGISVMSAGNKAGKAGHPYQCVNLFQKFTDKQFGVTIGGLGKAENYGKADLIKQFNNGKYPGSFTVYDNGGNIMPKENDIITWSHTNGVGHIGVIAEVVFDKNSGTGFVYSLEQNYSASRSLYAQALTRSYNDKGEAIYTVDGRGKYAVQAWTRYENQSFLNPNDDYTTILHTPAPGNYIFNQ